MKKFTLTTWLALFAVVFISANYLYTYLKQEPNKAQPEPQTQQEPQAQSEQAAQEPQVSPRIAPKNSAVFFADFQKVDGEVFVEDFELLDGDGEKVKLSDFRDKIVLLNFWASWCPPCKAEMPELNKLNKDFEEAGDIVLLTVNLTDGQRETVDIAKKFLDENEYSFRVLYDTEEAVSSYFGIQSIPSTFIIDKEGYLFSYVMGQTSEEKIMESIDELRR